MEKNYETVTSEAISKVPKTSSDDENTHLSEKLQDRIVLIPQPTTDPRDPLNWPFRKKATIVMTLCLALFAGEGAPICGQLNLKQQAILYHKSIVQITYFNSAGSAGFATGGIIWSPLSHKFGKSSLIFWAQLGCLACQVWAASMTHSNEYVAYAMSRYFAGFFGMIVSVLGAQYLVELFFLHQRGRAFTILHMALNFGASAAPTFGGYISASKNWPVEYWWSVALLGVTTILCFCFLEETGFDRVNVDSNPIRQHKFLKSRIETFFPGTKTVKPISNLELAEKVVLPFKIAISPVVLLVSAFNTISFGFYIALNALTPVWLQRPVEAGGYGFTISENASFTFVHWIGVAVGLLYGQFFSDRLPLALTARNKGVWKPEYRLYTLWITNFICSPIGLGLVGIGLKYHLHWICIAFGSTLVTIGSLVSIPVTVNYICECFRTHTVEATQPVDSMRLFLGLSINFYINGWVEAVGLGWVYGMMAFFSVFSFIFLIILMWKGDVIRKWTPFDLGSSEDGVHIIDEVVYES